MSRPSRLRTAVLLISAVAAILPSAAATAAWSEPRTALADGCGKTPPQPPGTSALQQIRSGGLDRTYQLHLPADYKSTKDWPLVLAFHGRGSTGAATEKFAKLSTLPAVVVYPNGVIGTGEGDRQAWQGAPYSAPGVDDVAFTRDLLDSLERTLCVDDRRVYATGKSNGAGFTGILACAMADRITAIAPVAGAFYPNGISCRPSRPVPVIEFHGTADATIPYTGDEDRGLPAIQSWVRQWADRDKCRKSLPQRQIGADITITGRTDCQGGVEVEHVAVSGGGHTWPGADSYSGGGVTTQTIEAHEVLWRFVRDYRLPR
ncbi:poly(3-hydroxybutyrate) depolymerase [Crossiella sp. SN42]|uniref:alpha/beta hydrolase family esterase n=1 Tax=Crossiella sp. SN42 TaxID=2944808 RepID=UPI00207D3E01|nr:poly(3-hydroxybutyrate) depolymerase [Crossiella sp. SN42]MCO1580588.1 poly(3-hydroxybutyrate) depolymerase [Crossiella sp. SN42]